MKNFNKNIENMKPGNVFLFNGGLALEIFAKVNGRFISTSNFGIWEKDNILMFIEFLELQSYLIFYNLNHNYYCCFHMDNLSRLTKIREKSVNRKIKHETW